MIGDNVIYAIIINYLFMTTTNLPNKIMVDIFLQTKCQTCHLILNKQIAHLLSSNYYWFLRLSQDFPKYPSLEFKQSRVDCKLLYELYHYKSKTKNKNGMKSKRKNSNYYKIYIIEFLLNKKRQKTIIPCYNSYNRMLVHKFCELKNLEHEKIQIGSKRGMQCNECLSCEISCNIDPYDGNNQYECRNCNTRLFNYSINLIKTKPYFGVLITKPQMCK